ncbi:DUF2436 domain-containing protein, partial [Odoribacter sp. OttesenSCG-928-L07]|nr:DUF2436 domain-containing protein [Odoribacter sp. OttesenSCG-928-L07]
WTIESNGNAAAITWRGFFSGNNLNGTPFAEANAETYGAIANEKLYSPIIDASGASELYLSFIQVFKVYQDDKADLLVYDGSDWVSVYTTTTNAGAWGNPNAQEIDVTAYANKDFQICFHFYSDWGYYWAIDDVMLSETPAKDRAVQSYKIWLDGVFAADVVTPYYQHDVTNLVEDQEYTTEVAVVYTSGISEKESFTWTYKPCELYGGAVTFEAEVTGNQEVTLNWTLPGGTTPPPPGDDMVRIELAANNVWGDGSGYVMLLDADANMYPEMPAGNFGGTMPAAFFNEFEYTIPEGATNTFATPSVVTGSAYIDIPAGTYDYVIVNPDGSNTWVAGAAGNANSKADNYVFEANKKYTFTMIYDDILDNDGPNLTIEDFNFGKAIINMQPIKPIIASTGEKSYSYGSARRTADQNTPQVLYSTGDLSLLTSTAEKAAVVSKETRADVLYDNNVPVTTSGLITVYWAASDVLVQIADDFEGVAGWSIEQIVTNGFCNTSTIPTTYGIHFYADDNGKPGEELYSNINCQGVEGDVITITLPEAYVIPSDGKYWISIYGVRSTAQDFNTRFDIFTSTTAIGSKLYLKDHANLFQGGTEWQPVDPGLVAGVVSMTFSLLGVAGDPPVPPAVEPILGVNIYRDGELLAFVKESITEYVDKDVAYGEHEYCIRVVYESLAMSCDGQCEPVMIDYPCDPTGNLEGVNPQNTQNALISWGAEPIEEWLYYDNGVNEDAIGGPASFIWAIKFDPSQLTHLEGTSLTRIMTYKYAAGTDELRIYQGTNAATLLHSQPLDGLVVGLYEEVELSSAVALDVTQQLWIGIATTNGANWPAATSSYMGNPNSAQISQDGGASWANVND